MNCFPCFSSQKSKSSPSKREANEQDEQEFKPPVAMTKRTEEKETKRTEERETEQTSVKTFNFRELATATKNFRQECLLGEGGFGRVYKGTLQSSGQVVAVKQLDKHGVQGSKEFQAEVLSLAKLEHPNLVDIIGYCADGDQRLLVFEYISGGSLQDHLYEQKANKKLIDWQTRMKIAYGAAQGLDYLHDKVNPPMLYRDLKASNILLDDEFFPKLSDFGMHNFAPKTGGSYLTSHVMDTYGYSAPEYTRGDEVTVKSDVYSFGVVMLELITGRRAVDTTKPNDEQNLVAWAQPIFRDPKRYPDMADPLLKKNFSERGLNQAVAITSMCLQEEPTARPLISDVMVALSFLSTSADEGVPAAVPATSFRDKSMSIALSRHDSCSVVPFSVLSKREERKSSVSSDSEDDEDDKSRSQKRREKETTARDSDDESDSDSEKGREEVHSKLEKPRSSSSSIDETNATAQSLKINYSYSSEDENNERISRKSSSKSNEESTSRRINSDDDDDDEEDEEKNHETRVEHIQSSKSEVQSVYSDDDDGGEESGRSSLHRNEPEEEEEHTDSDEE